MTAISYKNCFAPVVDDKTELLFLGSLPGDASLAAGQYYAHPRNQFWRLLGDLLDKNLVDMPYEQRLKHMLAHKIGLWDIIASAQRRGSLDSDLRDKETNNLQTLTMMTPNLRLIACNGNEAWRLTQSRYGAWLEQKQIQIVALPSSSPAYTLAFNKKLELWKNLITLAA